ncbi:DsrE family protein [Pyrobaculum calidifontis]|uniref:DsrE family protein n=1 Tax=Pyrobaculum calidifontis (strain DSM 21063 / JCM 11548 / VA1) TaxID=410359 RepID=A3MW46_PYRCJ|nr:DsrE family protein [Pyrobaculum calidifontis]ABO08863.1 DsrE family protein [Pyrobaculum calidifontis JCM 11548]
MPDKVAFLATMPPADGPRISTMLGYALAAASMGFEVLIFYTLDAAHIVKKKVFEKLDPQIRERFKQCMDMGCKMWLCSSAAATFNIKEDEVVEGVKIMGIASFYEYAAEAKVVLTW